jgi:uncharacterized protein with PIN domain
MAVAYDCVADQCAAAHQTAAIVMCVSEGVPRWGWNMSDPTFLADSMLGTLAKWLRILGYDTLYDAGLDDNQLVRLARAEGRVLLTRDTGFLQRRGLRLLFIESQVLEEQLAQVIQTCGLGTADLFTRCPICNTELEPVPKYEAWGQVPPYVFQAQEQFSLCPECNQFYWRGTHWQRMKDKLDSLIRPS